VKNQDPDDWRPEFLLALREDGTVTAACERAGIGRTTAYDHRNRDDVFRADWDEAYRAFWDDLEVFAHAKARSNTQSDALLIFLMKAHPSQMYKEKLQVGGDPESPPVKMEHDLSRLTSEELRQWRDLIRKSTPTDC